ncbi:MAG: YraN family protein [Nitrospirae bacterium]|nr:YraN family protein [Nitrospirota bacterium]
MKIGDEAEALAAGFLKRKGYRIIEKNYKTPFGEIDIIARDGGTLVFVEVKSRESLSFGKPFEAVSAVKRKKIANVALSYLKRLKEEPACRFDVVSIFFKDGEPQVELIRDAFEV